MLTKRIIPCLDVKNGNVVKGVAFRGLRDVGDPMECALHYQDQGADEIVFLDIAASIEDRATLKETVRETARELFIPLTVGGGIRGIEDMENLLRAGADKVSVNTAAVATPPLIREAAQVFGSQCVVVSVDAKLSPSRWKVYTHGGHVPTDLDAVEWAQRAANLGAGEILLTSIDADGTMGGYDIELTRSVCQKVDVPVIASGGCGSVEHIFEVLSKGGADAALAASIFHYGLFTIGQVKSFLKEKGLPVRGR